MSTNYLSVQEFARLKGVSRQGVYLLIKRGELDSVHLYEKTLIKNNEKVRNYQPHPGKQV